MEHPSIFSATLGLAYPWKVVTVAFLETNNRLDITVACDFGEDLACPCCGRKIKSAAVHTELWHHSDFLDYSAYLHARIPQLECPCGKTLPVARPWTRPGSKFVRLQ